MVSEESIAQAPYLTDDDDDNDSLPSFRWPSSICKFNHKPWKAKVRPNSSPRKIGLSFSRFHPNNSSDFGLPIHDNYRPVASVNNFLIKTEILTGNMDKDIASCLNS
jgi:hypothetical protein